MLYHPLFPKTPVPFLNPQKSNLEVMMESMLMAQQKQDEYIKQLDSKIVTTHNRMLQVQITQKDSFSSTPLDRLPSKPEQNSREQYNAMVFRGGKQLERLKEITNDESLHDKNEVVKNLEKEMSLPSKQVIDVAHESGEVAKDPKTTSPKPYSPPLLSKDG